MSDEAHISTEQSGSGPSAWLPATVSNCGRSEHSACAPGTGSEKAERLIDSRITTVKKRRDFLAANSAKRAASAGFVLQIRNRNDGAQAKRVGFTVTKKIGNAVTRNRLKRRLRAMARQTIGFDGVIGADHIFIGRAAGLDRNFELLRADLMTALAKLRR